MLDIFPYFRSIITSLIMHGKAITTSATTNPKYTTVTTCRSCPVRATFLRGKALVLPCLSTHTGKGCLGFLRATSKRSRFHDKETNGKEPIKNCPYSFLYAQKFLSFIPIILVPYRYLLTQNGTDKPW